MSEQSSNSKKKIVITGASGFLGRHLVMKLAETGAAGEAEVYALTSRPDGLKEEMKAVTGSERVEYLDRDAIDGKDAGRILPGAVVIACAYPRGSKGEDIADGLRYVRRTFESAVSNEAAAIINISSQSVYSQKREVAATENTPVCPESIYAVGKYAVELLLESICRGSDTSYTNIRMASLIGSDFDQRIVNRFVKTALETGKLTVNRSSRKFGFFDIEDAVNGILKMPGSDTRRWKPVYNLAGYGAYTLEEIAGIVKETVEKEKDTTVELDIRSSDETGSSETDPSLFCNDFSFVPECSLQTSVSRIAEVLYA
ncbi:MAG: NAD(P)-dependent oxidoreductase [Lachnospiraceae bacterium]|nr:NAD(P)-dependent oxidoreductase [Lachnospiraceae bacterium]